MKRGPGRPPHEPNDKDRRQVESMASYGISVAEIARVVQLSEATLRRHYAHELDTGHIKANALVAQSLFQKATGNGPGSVIAAIFWLKARAGWRDRDFLVEEEIEKQPILGKKEAAALAAEHPPDNSTLGELMVRRQLN